MFAKLLGLVLVILVVVALTARESGSRGPAQVYVVQPQDTLWSIATRHYSGDPREAIWRLRERNELPGTTIVPGQRLVLP